jgi:hypothetical protein
MGQSQITPTATSFFSSLIDYAGLFPPAALLLDESIKNYRDYLDHPNRWMLSRFVLTQAHLEKLTPSLVAPFSPARPLDLALVSKNPRGDIPAAVERLRSLAGSVSLGSLEVPLVSRSDIATSDIAAQIADCQDALSKLGSPGANISTFFELPLFDRWDEALPSVCAALSKARQQSKRLIGFKLRCGGTEPNLIPSPARVAHAISICARQHVPIKFTAGLHHPFQRSMRSGISSCGSDSMHGYFNVFFAAFAAHHCAISDGEVEELLLRSDSNDLVFGDEALRWGEITLPLDEIKRLRSSMVISFGSCSFIEPLDDAAKRGWI